MRKLPIYACTAAVLFAGSMTTTTYAAGMNTYTFPGGQAFVIGGNCGENADNIQNILNQLQGSFSGGCNKYPNFSCPGNIQFQPMKPSRPNQGNTGIPNIPGINIPDINVPDQNIPDVPDQGNPELPDNGSQSDYTTQIVKLVNEERAKAGLKALSVNTKAEQAAQVRVLELEKSFSHTRPNGSYFSTALTSAGINYQSAGENIAYGQKTPAQAMNAWMNSSGHRANILSNDYTSIAVGHYRNAAGVDYWEQLFIR